MSRNRIDQVLLLILTTVVKTTLTKPLVQRGVRIMQPNNDLPHEAKIFRSPQVSKTLLSDKDEGLFRLPNTLTKKPSTEGTTKKLNFRKRISSPAIHFQTNSAKPIGAALLKEAVQRTQSKPSCGVTDPPKRPSSLADRILTRRRRYVLHGSKLVGPTITWNVPCNSRCTKLSDDVVNTTLTKAFRIWAERIPLVFRWVEETTTHDITIKFVKGSHGDLKPFDGPGGHLAHAYYPRYSSDIHFDDDEPWTADSPSKSLLRVAVHEIGHSLGLMHSDVSGSIMNAFYVSTSSSNVRLNADDIAGAQAQYGMCQLPSIDGIESSMYDYKSYAFKDDLFWEFDDQSSSTVPGSPRKISSFWKGVPDKLDTILLWGWNWHLYFFKGSYYYKFNGNQVYSGYPKKICSGWQGVPDNIDAAFTVSSQVTYFLKGDLVYKFLNYYDQVDPNFPVAISNIWPGVPNNVDAAFRWYYDGQLYFFKDEYFYKWSTSEGIAKGPYNTQLEWKSLCYV